jgi:RND superfamily putative drug exporter
MDYEVFLLSAVQEHWARTGDNRVAVRRGLAETGGVITSAALIMVCVFASFVLVDNPTVKIFGLGLATAIVVDATIVRCLLVPATMVLLGRWNWWLPRWLDRLLPHLLDHRAPAPEPALVVMAANEA